MNKRIGAYDINDLCRDIEAADCERDQKGVVSDFVRMWHEDATRSAEQRREITWACIASAALLALILWRVW